MIKNHNYPQKKLPNKNSADRSKAKMLAAMLTDYELSLH